MKRMRIRIKRDGKTEIRVEGAQGDECLAFTQSVENALGQVQTREMCQDAEDPLAVREREGVRVVERG
jgi:hypothetical protein